VVHRHPLLIWVNGQNILALWGLFGLGVRQSRCRRWAFHHCGMNTPKCPVREPQNSPSTLKTPANQPFFVSRANFVTDIARRLSSRASFISLTRTARHKLPTALPTYWLCTPPDGHVNPLFRIWAGSHTHGFEGLERRDMRQRTYTRMRIGY